MIARMRQSSHEAHRKRRDGTSLFTGSQAAALKAFSGSGPTGSRAAANQRALLPRDRWEDKKSPMQMLKVTGVVGFELSKSSLGAAPPPTDEHIHFDDGTSFSIKRNTQTGLLTYLDHRQDVKTPSGNPVINEKASFKGWKHKEVKSWIGPAAAAAPYWQEYASCRAAAQWAIENPLLWRDAARRPLAHARYLKKFVKRPKDYGFEQR